MLEEVFGSKINVAVLRLLVMRPEWIFSESEIARELGVPKATLHRKMKKLAETGVVLRYKKGKTVIYRLDEKNYIVKTILLPMFKRELESPLKVAKEFSGELNTLIRVAVVFGSAAKGNMKPWSDIDIALITDNPKKLEKKLNEIKTKYLEQKGAIISTHIFDTNDFRHRYKKDPHIKDIANGKVVFGNLDALI
jgi:predicted nucleotidyltransferase